MKTEFEGIKMNIPHYPSKPWEKWYGKGIKRCDNIDINLLINEAVKFLLRGKDAKDSFCATGNTIVFADKAENGIITIRVCKNYEQIDIHPMFELHKDKLKKTKRRVK